jgi:hypothetical protein
MYKIDEQTTGIDTAMVRVLASNAVDPGFEPLSGQTKDYKIDMCFSATHTALKIIAKTDTDRSASYLDLHLEIVSERRLRTKLYDKRHDINFPIVSFQFIRNNIPAAPVYGVYISPLIRYLDLVVPIRISLMDDGY